MQIIQKFPPTATAAHGALAQIMAQLSPDAPRRNDVELALAEAMNNVVDHAHSGGHVAVTHDNREIRIDIHDQGGVFFAPPHMTSAPETTPTRGFGWTIMRAVSDKICHQYRNGGNHITMTFFTSSFENYAAKDCVLESYARGCAF